MRYVNYRQQISGPSLESVCSADLVEDLDSGAEIKVIGVVENEGDSEQLHLLWG